LEQGMVGLQVHCTARTAGTGGGSAVLGPWCSKAVRLRCHHHPQLLKRAPMVGPTLSQRQSKAPAPLTLKALSCTTGTQPDRERDGDSSYMGPGAGTRVYGDPCHCLGQMAPSVSLLAALHSLPSLGPPAAPGICPCSGFTRSSWQPVSTGTTRGKRRAERWLRQREAQHWGTGRIIGRKNSPWQWNCFY